MLLCEFNAPVFSHYHFAYSFFDEKFAGLSWPVLTDFSLFPMVADKMEV